MSKRNELRTKMISKYGGRCAYCGGELELKTMQVDHIVPKYNGGGDEEDNLNPSCRQCNFYKGTHSLELFRKTLKTLHNRISKPFIARLGIKYGIITITPFDGVFYFEKLKQEEL